MISVQPKTETESGGRRTIFQDSILVTESEQEAVLLAAGYGTVCKSKIQISCSY